MERTATSRAYSTALIHINALLASSANFEENDQEWKYIKGNALLLKAYIYFDLLQLFSERYAPNKLGIIPKNRLANESNARLTQQESVALIHSLLQEGIALIETFDQPKGYFITLKGAQLLQAQVALFERDYQKATTLAEKLIETSDPLPSSSLEYLALWENKSSTIYWYYNYQKRPNFYLYYEKDKGDFLYVHNAFTFSSNDIRAQVSQYNYAMKQSGNTSIEKPYLGKYKQVHTDQSDSDLIMARNTESYFLLAEALIEQQQLQKAVSTLNIFLTSVGETPLENTYDKKSLLLILQHQKQKEFIGEKLNFFDAKRWQIDSRRNIPDSNKTLTTIVSEDYRWTWPLPLSEIRQNTAAVQNPGWVAFD